MLIKKCIITTNVKIKDNIEIEAKKLAKELNIQYIKREKFTIKELLVRYSNIFVLYSNKLVYYGEDNSKLFFHLDTAIIRIKSNNDPLIKIIGSNKKVLDMTLGLARDSVVMSYNGNIVTALESNEIIYTIVSYGLKNYDSKNKLINASLRKIDVLNVDNYEYLKKCPSNYYDILYIDPMFSHKIKNSNNLLSLEKFVNKDSINDKLFLEMIRVAKEKIIVKAHNKDTVFEKYKLEKKERVGSKFSYGVYNIKK